MDIFSYSGCGLRPSNQDFFLCHRLPDNRLVAVVADGMGGYAYGDVAAEVVARSVVEHVSEAGGECAPDDVLRSALAYANEMVEIKRISLGVRNMGAVVVVAVVSERAVCFAWLGDSRGCVVRDGHVAVQTVDHSMVADLRRRRTRSLTAEEAARFSSVVLRAVMGRAVSDEPSVAYAELKSGDSVILCSDGLHRNVADLATLPSDGAQLESFLDSRTDKWDDNYTLIRITV
ncbi:MAG: PP2C family protein-serine/threonine phosphatase [Marinilabiliaceae bacterium]